MKRLFTILSAVAAWLSLLTGTASGQWIAYHDMGGLVGESNTQFVTYHQLGTPGNSWNSLNTSPVSLLIYEAGTDTGVALTIAGANAMYSRYTANTTPAASTPPAEFLPVPGLELMAKNRIEGGLDLAVWYLRNQKGHGREGRIPKVLDYICLYGAHAKRGIPELEEHADYYCKNRIKRRPPSPKGLHTLRSESRLRR